MAPSNSLPIHGNEKTMNLNSLVLANIQASPYFKVQLYELKTYHQVIDEIYYKVNHLEPWEKGSRKTAGQTGMCGGVRGVGAGGIVSSAYCLLYKLYTLKLTRKQLIGLCTHSDSTFIRALGLMYIRYTQPPSTFWEWYEPYLDDEEEVDCKAGGGNMMTIGEIAYQMLVKLEWYGTLFPRIPVPIQKDIERKLQAYKASKNWNQGQPARQGAGENGGGWAPQQPAYDENEPSFGEAERMARKEGNDSVRPPIPRRSPPTRDQVAEDRHSRHDSRSHSSRHSPDRRQRSRSRSRHHDKKSREKRRPRSREEKHSSKSREGRHHRSRSRERRRRSRSRDERRRSRSPRDDRHKKSRDYVMSRRGDSAGQKRRSSSHESGFERDLQKEIHRVRSMKGSDSRNGDD